MAVGPHRRSPIGWSPRQVPMAEVAAAEVANGCTNASIAVAGSGAEVALGHRRVYVVDLVKAGGGCLGFHWWLASSLSF